MNRFNPWQLPIEEDFIKACDEVTGYDKKPTDPWSGDHIGFFNTLGVVCRTGPNKGKRSYAARGMHVHGVGFNTWGLTNLVGRRS